MWSLAVGLGAGLGAEPPLKLGGGAQPFPRAASAREGTHPVMGGHVLPWGTRLAMGTRSVTWPMFSHGANIPSRDVADHVLPCGWVPSWGHVLPRGHIVSQLPTPPSPAQPSPTAGPQRDPSHRHPMGTARGQQRQLPPGLQHPGTALCVHGLRGTTRPEGAIPNPGDIPTRGQRQHTGRGHSSALPWSHPRPGSSPGTTLVRRTPYRPTSHGHRGGHGQGTAPLLPPPRISSNGVSG